MKEATRKVRKAMPNCCKFIDRETNQAINLVDLDELLCKIVGIVPNEKQMCMAYNAICLTGFAILRQSGKSKITKEDLYEYMKDKDFKDNDIFERFLIRDFEFEAWYEAR